MTSTAGSDDPRSDAELLRSARRDPAAFRTVYDRHAAAVHAFALRRTGDDHAALEVTAETFARAWYHRSRFRDRRAGSARPWLYGIAANVLRESARRRRVADRAVVRLGVRLGLDRPAAAPDPSWVDGLDDDLSAAIDALPDGQRRAVVGRILEDQTYDQLAVSLDCSPGAARVRVSRGLDQLRRTITEDRS